MKFRVCFLILVLFLPSCATIGGTRQTIAFDSKPRGLKLAVNTNAASDDQATPYTDEIKRSDSLNLVYHSGDFVHTEKVRCDFRYGTTLLGNLGFALPLLATPTGASLLYLTAVGTDFLSQNAFECPQLVKSELKLPEAIANEVSETCAPVLILPPKNENDNLSLNYALIAEAQEFLKRFDKDCHSFVPSPEVVAALNRSSAVGLNLVDLFQENSQRKLVQIIRDTRAIRGIDMKISSQKANFVEVEFVLRDLYSKQQIASFKKNFSRQKIDKLKSGWITQTLGKSLRLVPNSFALLVARPNLTLDTTIPYTSEIITKQSLIGLLSVTSVQHPDQFNPWDAAFEFGPSLFFDSIHNRISFDRDTPEGAAFVNQYPDAAGSTDFSGYTITLPIDGVVSFHTPAGAFRIFLGYGPGAYQPTSPDAQSKSVKFLPLVHFGFDWLAYFSKNAFFQLGLHGFGTGKDSPIESRKYLSFSGWASATFGVGYYFPNTKGYLESLLAKNK